MTKVLAGSLATLLTLVAAWSLYNLLVPDNQLAIGDCSVYKAVAFSLLLLNSVGHIVSIFQWANKSETNTTQL